MSGITPLIDTLLHQVLGKRVDVPVPRELNAPVQPASPSDAIQSLHSDSRLDPRQRTVQPPLMGRAADAETPSVPGRPAGQAPASTQTHFSPSAQTIASVLDRFPAPPATLRVQVPLMPAGASVETAAQVASRLQQSIDTSGLFYESHLSKWYRGELPRQQLALEPQMQRVNATGPFTQFWPVSPAPSPMLLPGPRLVMGAGSSSGLLGSVPLDGAQAGARPGVPGALSSRPGTSIGPGGSAASIPQPDTAGRPLSTTGQTPQASPAERVATPLPGVAEASLHGSASADGLDESLQGVVRQQLEMLATPTPVLRWEGDVWSGVFMALIVQMPVGRPSGGEDSPSDESADEDGSGAWQTQMSLEVAGLGRLDVRLRLAGKHLDITLDAQNQTVLARLQEGEAGLRARLQACGFEAIGLQMTQQREGDAL